MSVLMGAELNAFAAANLASAMAHNQLVTIPGGTFQMGSGSPFYASLQGQPTTVSTFQMTRDDVTNAHYRSFLHSLGDRRVALICSHPVTGVEHVLALGSSKEEIEAARETASLVSLLPGAEEIATFGEVMHLVDSRRFVQIGEPNIPSGFDRPQQPVVRVSWYEAFIYAYLQGGMLPSGAQFEYAARVYLQGNRNNSGSPYRNGALSVVQGSELREYATASGNLTRHEAHYDRDAPADVGSYPALPNGLRDMCGNVWKWMQNWFEPYPKNTATDPAGPRKGEYKSLRGGTFDSRYPQILCAANGNDEHPNTRRCDIGFRWVASPEMLQQGL